MRLSDLFWRKRPEKERYVDRDGFDWGDMRNAYGDMIAYAYYSPPMTLFGRHFDENWCLQAVSLSTGHDCFGINTFKSPGEVTAWCAKYGYPSALYNSREEYVEARKRRFPNWNGN